MIVCSQHLYQCKIWIIYQRNW